MTAQKTRADLEWDRVLGALAARCVFAPGKDAALGLPLLSREDAEIALAEAREAATLFDASDPLPIGDVPDPRDGIGRARIGAMLSPVELCHTGRMLEQARVLRRWLGARKDRAPRLFLACATDATLDRLADEISGSFDADGTLCDRASPRLAELRGEWRASRARMIRRLDELMIRYAGIVQDTFVTEREGRWVIPVRADAHERFPGIIHGASGSGATLFVEPRAVIPMGNRLKVLEGEISREELEVYARLSALVMDQLPSVEAAAQALARADVRLATAKLAAELQLAFPTILPRPELRLVSARHPLLLLDGTKVVPQGLAIRAGHAIVVSGPNAGGKTVALKTMGLCALMVRAGLPIPADASSEIGLFDPVLTDVGDDQSLSMNLSTFSAHVKNLARILEETHEGALVLLDEIATGTDPREGEALAAGILDSLVRRGGAVVATTHYEGLKALALGDARFENASCGFDLATMSPTFEIIVGLPGSSSALFVAKRFGIPETVLERARGFLSREDQDFEALVKRLSDERAALELATNAARQRGDAADEARRALEEEILRVRDRTHAEVAREARALEESVRRAREELRLVHATLRQKRHEPAEVKQAERALDRVAEKLALGGELETALSGGGAEGREPVAEGELRRGGRVYVARIRGEAEILEILGKEVRVAAGAMKITVPLSEVFQPARRAGSEEAEARPRARQGAAPREGREVAIQTSDNTVDLRGLSVDDAVSLAMTFLDRCIGARIGVAFLVHGHGTGALREAIRRELQSSRYVAHFRAGEQGEGGDGVTVVWLA